MVEREEHDDCHNDDVSSLFPPAAWNSSLFVQNSETIIDVTCPIQSLPTSWRNMSSGREAHVKVTEVSTTISTHDTCLTCLPEALKTSPESCTIPTITQPLEQRNRKKLSCSRDRRKRESGRGGHFEQKTPRCCWKPVQIVGHPCLSKHAFPMSVVPHWCKKCSVVKS